MLGTLERSTDDQRVRVKVRVRIKIRVRVRVLVFTFIDLNLPMYCRPCSSHLLADVLPIYLSI